MDECVCPVCFVSIPYALVNNHVDECLRSKETSTSPSSSPLSPSSAHQERIEDADRAFALKLMAMDMEERKRREEQEERLFLEFLQKQVNEPPAVLSSYKCIKCNKEHALESLHFLDCTHSACKSCLRTSIIEKINSKKISQISCLECNTALPMSDIKELINGEEYNKYEAASMQELLDTNNSTFKRCPNPKCNSVLELMKSQPSMGQSSEIGPNGSHLSVEAAKHKQEFRFRCYECNTAFCAECDTSPYHLGYTCEQYKAFLQAKHCRFCDAQLTPANTYVGKNTPHALVNVCNSAECKAMRETACGKTLICGHWCCGIKNESECLKCLHPSCVGEGAQQNGSDFCNICWVSELQQAPCIQLACGHVFHLECTKKKLHNRWAGTRITFGFMECALCKQMINHPALQEELKPILELREQVKNKALQRLRFVEGDKKLPELTDPSSKWHNNAEGYAMYRFAYFLCYKCKTPYFGGERACEEERADFDPKELLCGGCSGVAGQEICATHGKEFIEYKCKFCCSMSVFFCWGTTHFCDACHKKAGTIARVPKEELPKCNCNVKHPANGEEFCFGCSYCRIMHTF